MATCSWLPTLWVWEPAGFIAPREEFESPEGKTLLAKWGITGDYIGVGHCILGYPPQRPRPLPPKREFCYKSLNFELQNRREADILKSSQLPESLEECV